MPRQCARPHTLPGNLSEHPSVPSQGGRQPIERKILWNESKSLQNLLHDHRGTLLHAYFPEIPKNIIPWYYRIYLDMPWKCIFDLTFLEISDIHKSLWHEHHWLTWWMDPGQPSWCWPLLRPERRGRAPSRTSAARRPLTQPFNINTFLPFCSKKLDCFSNHTNKEWQLQNVLAFWISRCEMWSVTLRPWNRNRPAYFDSELSWRWPPAKQFWKYKLKLKRLLRPALTFCDWKEPTSTKFPYLPISYVWTNL